MEKRYQVFVSSTYTDLIEERKEVTQAILKCDCFPAGMELFPASNKQQWTIIKNVIDDSDFYILIIAGRYGSLGIDDNGKKIGFTEMEFNYAVSIKKPIIVLLHRNPESLSARFVEKNKNNIQRLKKFIEKASNGRMLAFWENKDQLHSAVLDSLIKAKQNTPEAVGWIRANNYTDSKTVEPSLSIATLISELEHMDSSYEQIEFLKSINYEKRNDFFKNEHFIRYFLHLLDTNNTESMIWEAIILIPHYPYLDKHIKNIILSEAKIIGLYQQLCIQAEHQTSNKLLIHTIRLLRNINEFGDEYSIPIFNILKSDYNDKELIDACFNYCEFLCGSYGEKRGITKDIIDYILCRLKNKEQLIPIDKWIYLLLASCIYESDIKLIHEVFFANDNETKQCVLDGMYRFCGANVYIHDIKMQKLFFDIYDEVYSWNDDYYTSGLLQYCLFTRTDDIFTVDEIYEKLDNVNDDVFYMFFRGIQYGEFNPNFQESYELNDDEKERIKGIIKSRNHPRGRKLLELFK